MKCLHCIYEARYSFGYFCDAYGRDCDPENSVGDCRYFSPDGETIRKYPGLDAEEIRRVEDSPKPTLIFDDSDSPRSVNTVRIEKRNRNNR